MMYIEQDEDALPSYTPVATTSINRSNTTTTAVTASTSTLRSRELPLAPPTPLNIPVRNHSRRSERYVYSYYLAAGSLPLQFLITVEPALGKPVEGNCTFRLSVKIDAVERTLCEPLVLKLSIDPRQLNFVVFMFPGKASIPAGCLYSFRVWLRANGVDHRIFSDDDFWIAKDPDFPSIADASFSRLKSVSNSTQIYQAIIGRAMINFTIRWQPVEKGLYKYSLEYDGGGIGAVLYDDWKLRLDCDPRSVSFIIYSVPIPAIPPGASHRLRFWARSPVPAQFANSGALPFNDSYIYQRLWKSDTFRVGANLAFDTLGSKAVMGVPAGAPQVVVTISPSVKDTSYSSPEKAGSRRSSIDPGSIGGDYVL